MTQFEEYKQRADELQLAISLPTRVYRCDYCHKLVRDDQVFGNSMNQPMQSHQEREHRIPGGTTRIAFTVLKTIAEVQAVITDSLPAIAVCQACSAPVLSANPQDRDDHAETHYREMMLAE
ncbi:MAG: hypothetical protein M0Z53_14285 [Thermaerobacter sp.]|nr:hypothetical protein [Thermaerobacter sp.]